MKTFLKILGFILGLLALLVAIWYFYFFKRFSTLQDNDRQTILESLKPDTTGKGYSDASERLIEEDLNNITSFNKEKKEFFSKWYKYFLKMQRITILSKDRASYLKNSINNYKAFNCFNLYMGDINDNKNTNFNFFNSKFENDNFVKYFNILEKKNFRFLSTKEIFTIQNPEMDEEKCNLFEKELQK